MVHVRELLYAVAGTTALLYLVERVWPASVLMHLSIGAFFVTTTVVLIAYLIGSGKQR